MCMLEHRWGPRKPVLTSPFPGVRTRAWEHRPENKTALAQHRLCRLYKTCTEVKPEASHYCSSQHLIPLHYFHSSVPVTFAWNSTLSTIYIPGTLFLTHEIHVVQDIKNKYYFRKCKDFQYLIANLSHFWLCTVWMIDYIYLQ